MKILVPLSIAGILVLAACGGSSTEHRALEHEQRGHVAVYVTETPGSLPPAVGEISPVWYSPTSNGQLMSRVSNRVRTTASARKQGVALQPGVNNYVGGLWNADIVMGIISKPRLRAAHIQALVRVAVDNGYPGIDVDYESLPSSARTAYSTFITELGQALHAHTLNLSIAIPPQDESPVYGDSHYAYDYAAIGKAVDQLRVMAYDYSWVGSPPGPVAPTDWVEQVLDYALSQVPPNKVMLGLAGYGYDWVGSRGTSLTATEAVALAKAQHVKVHRTGGQPWFTYTSAGITHTVWYQDARGTAQAILLAHRRHVGLFLWKFGGEDPTMWTQPPNQISN
jgi:spore germination protein